jgi:DNA-binding transcriptional MerR regulator/methylmalonyl-CoA mutase cobalamin-binding subunit
VRTIGAVSALTGLSVHILRVWEKRYEVVTPQRDSRGHRLYSTKDIQRLRSIAILINRGYGISKIVELRQDELLKLIEAESQWHPHPQIINLLNRILKSIRNRDYSALKLLLLASATSLSSHEFIEDLLTRVMREVGDANESSKLNSIEDHEVWKTVSEVLLELIEKLLPFTHSPLVFITTIGKECHELGALAATYFAIAKGVRATYLAADQSVSEIAEAAIRAGVAAIGLSSTYIDDGSLVAQVQELRASLPKQTVLWLGGSLSPALNLHLSGNIQIIKSLDEFQSQLELLCVSVSPAVPLSLRTID